MASLAITVAQIKAEALQLINEVIVNIAIINIIVIVPQLIIYHL